MFRTSSYLAIALSVTAIASATTPATALSSQFSGVSSLAAQSHAAPAITSVQPNQQISHFGPKAADYPPNIKMPQSPGVSTSIEPIKYPMPKYPGVGSVFRKPEIPVSELPPPKLPIPIDNVCPDNPMKCQPHPQPPQPQPQPHPGPVVIIAPQVPVQVPVVVPYGVAGRVTAGPSYAATSSARPAAAAPTTPSTAQPADTQCAASGNIPPLAAGIDQLLPTAQISEDDKAKVIELRQTIEDLSANGKLAAARNVEEVAMYYLGYQKIWLQCGAGSFAWTQAPTSNTAQTSTPAVSQSAALSK